MVDPDGAEDDAAAELTRLRKRCELLTDEAGHGLRSHLAVISNSLHFITVKLRQAGVPNERIEKHLGKMREEIRSASKKIDRIVSIARGKDPDSGEGGDSAGKPVRPTSPFPGVPGKQARQIHPGD